MFDLTIVIAFISFVLSFLFALGGVGSALVLIPSLTWLGVPFNLARTTGLFVNCLSMLGATYSNIKAKRLDFKLGLPIIISSIVLAPVGAWAGHFLSIRIIFLCLSGSSFFPVA
nr:sulfite exporter TauE/SafE family protein [Maridesulfovibrio ferrireducens]